LKNFLKMQSWPEGLQNLVLKSILVFPLRFFIVDDSGSMAANDGHRLITEGNKSRFVFVLPF